MRSVLSLIISVAFTCLITSIVMANNRIKLPDIGNSSGTIITGEIEKKLGRAFLRHIRRRVPISNDQEITDYVQSLGQTIAKASEQPNRDFNFFVVRDHRINAFAGPNGNIGINSGLIVETESESELASVFAHEVAHVTQQHLQRAIETASQLSIPNAAATLAAVIIGAALPGVGPAAVLAVQAGQVQQQINFTRRHEAEADRVGLQNLASAGFDPRSMPVFFGRLQTASQYYGQRIPEILKTHPAPVSRISETAARAEKFPFKQVTDSQDYRLIRMKLRLKHNLSPIKEFITTLENETKQGVKGIREAAQYGLALALMEENDYQRARDILTELSENNPSQSHYLTARALNEYLDKKPKKSLQLFQIAMQRFPQKRAVNLLYARVLLHNGMTEQALTYLQRDVERYEPTPFVYDLLSIAYGQNGQNTQGYQARAEYFFSIGQTKDAIIQLEQALLSAKDNFYLTSQIENRLIQFEDDLKAPPLL